MALIGKKVLILGGNGYLGNYFAARFVQQQASVMCLSRSGPRHKHPENSQIQWVNGNILQTENIKKKINTADIIVHTIGTLFDTSVSKKTQPGGTGTYEQVNRDTLVSLLQSLEEPKKIIYISSAGHPPFLNRYLLAKHQAEQILFKSQNEGYSLRPGFIYSLKWRIWSLPVKWSIDIWRNIYPVFERIFPTQSSLARVLKEFKQGENVGLEDLTDSVLQIARNGAEQKINQVDSIRKLSLKFRKQHPQ